MHASHEARHSRGRRDTESGKHADRAGSPLRLRCSPTLAATFDALLRLYLSSRRQTQSLAFICVNESRSTRLSEHSRSSCACSWHGGSQRA